MSLFINGYTESPTLRGYGIRIPSRAKSRRADPADGSLPRHGEEKISRAQTSWCDGDNGGEEHPQG
jgi:hypothetical protein